MSVLQHDCRELAAVVALAFEAGAAVAEKACLLGKSVARGALHSGDAGACEPAFDIAAKIEHEMPVAPRWRKKGGVVGALGEEGRGKLRPDLVGALRDAGADAGAD